jgi:hypothetical protein
MMQHGILDQCRQASWLMLLLAGTIAGEPSGGAVACRVESLRLQPAYARTLALWPDAIVKGEKAVLSWCIPATVEVLIERSDDIRRGLVSLGRFKSQGSLDLWPQATTMFVISYGDPETPCVRSIWVTVH